MLFPITGDLEMIHGLSSYAQTTQCTEAAEVFILDQRNYERLIEKRNPQSLDLMSDALHEKLALRMSLAQETDLPLFRYFLYKLDERKRHERIRQREYSRKRDIRETIDYWKSGKLHHGPLIDQFGPGSVFYTIRMRAKSRRGLQRSKTAGGNFGITSLAVSRNQSGAYLSRHGDHKESNQSLNRGGAVHSKSMVKSHQKHESEGTDEELSDSDMDIDMPDGGGRQTKTRSSVLCDNKSMRSKASKSSKTRSSCSVDEFMNQELTDLTLSRLETKIEEWHTKVNKLEEDGRSSRLDKKHLVKLHRYNADENKKPLPGTKIILRHRAPPKATALTRHLEAMETANQSAPSPATVNENSPSLSRDLDARDQTESRGSSWNDETDFGYRKCTGKRPQSSKSAYSSIVPVQMMRRPKSARNYTAHDYIVLKEELRRKQIAYKSILTRSTTCFI